MPSRSAVAIILLFWLGTVGYLGYARVLPWLTATGAPAVAVSATDEASRMKARWVVLFKTDTGPFQKAGSLVSELKTDDGGHHTFLAKYTDVRFDLGPFPVRVPSATTEVTVDRSGQLRRQSFTGSAVFQLGGLDITGAAAATSHVVGGELRGRVEGEITGLFEAKLLPTDLPPVPVSDGQVLNPMLPLNRLAGVHPGKERWTIRLSDPLADSLRQLIQAAAQNNKLGGFVPDAGPPETLLAEVQPDPEPFPVRRGEEPVPCWVIVYRGKDHKVAARTLVAVADGRVMRQEAIKDGNTLRLDRDE